MFVYVKKQVLIVLTSWLRKCNVLLYPTGLRLLTAEYMTGKLESNKLFSNFSNSETIKYTWILNKSQLETIFNYNFSNDTDHDPSITDNQILCHPSFNIYFNCCICLGTLELEDLMAFHVILKDKHPLLDKLSVFVRVNIPKLGLYKQKITENNAFDALFYGHQIAYEKFVNLLKKNDIKNELSVEYYIQVIKVKNRDGNTMDLYNIKNEIVLNTNTLNEIKKMLFDIQKMLQNSKINEKNEFENWLRNEVKLYNEYFETFINNGFDNMESIVELNDECLINDLGITKKGHRIKILKYIQKYKNQKEKLLN